jgi:DNA-binding XRE family transcriptional regulator
MQRVEKIRVREGLTKRDLAAEIGASEDGLHSWI